MGILGYVGRLLNALAGLLQPPVTSLTVALNFGVSLMREDLESRQLCQKPPSLAVALKCGIGSRFLNALVGLSPVGPSQAALLELLRPVFAVLTVRAVVFL
jgi:hypothetical protein